MKCPNCGKEIADDSLFCELCGAHIAKPKKGHKALWITLVVLIFVGLIGGIVYHQNKIQKDKMEAANRLAEIERYAREEAEAKAAKAEAEAQEAKTKQIEAEKALLSSFITTSDGVVILTDDNFDEFEALSYYRPIIIDFYADWCPPCRQMAPIISDLAKSYDSKLIIGRYDTDKGSVKQNEYDVTSIPNIYFIKNGSILKHQIGSCEESYMRSLIQEAFDIQ